MRCVSRMGQDGMERVPRWFCWGLTIAILHNMVYMFRYIYFDHKLLGIGCACVHEVNIKVFQQDGQGDGICAMQKGSPRDWYTNPSGRFTPLEYWMSLFRGNFYLRIILFPWNIDCRCVETISVFEKIHPSWIFNAYVQTWCFLGRREGQKYWSCKSVFRQRLGEINYSDFRQQKQKEWK